jgi:hypothetical protein
MSANVFSPVLSKPSFARRYLANEFGNRAPSWDTLSEYLKSGYRGGLVHIRNRVAGGPTWYDVEPGAVEPLAQRIVARGIASWEQLYFSGMAPTRRTSLQGEAMETETGLYLYYSRVPKPMRASLLEGGRDARGIVARELLRYYMDSSSYDGLRVLFDRYPEHVVEFSCYSVNWGTLPNRNTIIWEVRKY